MGSDITDYDEVEYEFNPHDEFYIVFRLSLPGNKQLAFGTLLMVWRAPELPAVGDCIKATDSTEGLVITLPRKRFVVRHRVFHRPFEPRRSTVIWQCGEGVLMDAVAVNLTDVGQFMPSFEREFKFDPQLQELLLPRLLSHTKRELRATSKR